MKRRLLVLPCISSCPTYDIPLSCLITPTCRPLMAFRALNQAWLCCCFAVAAAPAGGKLVVQYQKKPTKHPRCGATGVVLHGVSGVAVSASNPQRRLQLASSAHQLQAPATKCEQPMTKAGVDLVAHSRMEQMLQQGGQPQAACGLDRVLSTAIAHSCSCWQPTHCTALHCKPFQCTNTPTATTLQCTNAPSS